MILYGYGGILDAMLLRSKVSLLLLLLLLQRLKSVNPHTSFIFLLGLLILPPSFSTFDWIQHSSTISTSRSHFKKIHINNRIWGLVLHVADSCTRITFFSGWYHACVIKYSVINSVRLFPVINSNSRPNLILIIVYFSCTLKL